jgi:regulator of replication initiation timing
MRVGAKERAEARAVAEMPGSFAECWREIQDLRAEVERLRGIVQADLEEKAEAAVRNGELREVLHGLISVRFNEDAAEVEAAYDAAKDTLRAGLSAGGG